MTDIDIEQDRRDPFLGFLDRFIADQERSMRIRHADVYALGERLVRERKAMIETLRKDAP